MYVSLQPPSRSYSTPTLWRANQGPVHLSLPRAMTIAAFFGMSVSNLIEILFFIFRRFKHRKGLYFWSMLVACIEIPVHAIAVLVRTFGLVSNVAMSFAVVLGWWAMVTGHAVVLYSRLHLVSDQKKTRRVLIMIVTNFIVLHLPVSALYLDINVRSFNSLTNVFKIYEKIQLAGSSIQEYIIAGIYIWEASLTLNHVLNFREPQGKNDSAPSSCQHPRCRTGRQSSRHRIHRQL